MDMENFQRFREQLRERCQERIDAGIIPIFDSDRPPKRSRPVRKPKKAITAEEMKGTLPSTKEQSCCLALGRKPKEIRCRREHFSIPYTSKMRKLGMKNKLKFLKSRKAPHDFICLHHWRMIKYSNPISRWPHSSNEREGSPDFMEKLQIQLDEDSEESDEEEECKSKRRRSTTPLSSEEVESEAESTISSLGSAEYTLSESEEDDLISMEDDNLTGDEDDDESEKKEEEVSDDEEETEPQRLKESHPMEEEEMEEDTKHDEDYATDDEEDRGYLDPWNFDHHIERLTEEKVVEVPYEPAAHSDPCNWQRFCFADKAETSSDEDSDDESETEGKPKIGLHLLPAATLRRYRKAFHIPTRASATKNVMLRGVSQHFSLIEVDRSSTLAAFLAKTKNDQVTSDEEEEEE